MSFGITLILLFGGFINPPYWTSPSSGITMDVCTFDANNDEYLDIVFAIYMSDGSGELHLYLNNNGYFAQTPDWISEHTAAYQALCVGDVDNDGDNDIAAGTVRYGTEYAYNCLFLNDGTGNFSQYPIWLSMDDLDTVYLQLVDIDSDGWLELISANHNSKILLYENYFQSGGLLDPTPSLWFSNASVTTFTVSQLPINDTSSETVDIISANPSSNPHILVNKIFNYNQSLLPPVEMVWEDLRTKPPYGYWFQCADINRDSYIDWISSYQSGIIYSEFNPQQDTYYQDELQEINNYPGLDDFDFRSVMKVFAVDIVPEVISPGVEVFVCNRGLRRFIPGISPPQHEMHQSEDLLLSLDFLDEISATVIWQSAMKIPTTSVSFCDIDRSGILTTQSSFLITKPNQMFTLDIPFERILSVNVGGFFLQRDQYHFDRSKGIISIIGDYSANQLTVIYEKSVSLDVVCSTTEHDIIMLNEY